jgi:hypothetical protein
MPPKKAQHLFFEILKFFFDTRFRWLFMQAYQQG